jgi:asparagine synthase (glutamine-hydrolysing)
MCGIAGFVRLDRTADGAPLLRRLTDAVRHRGPDDDGFFFAPGVGLGMRRLSIVDVACSQQPITNEDGTIHLVFNGEIYNYVELREQLQRCGHTFRTNGDTETLVHLYEEHGAGMLQHLRGMFAFALWDSREEVLFCARDRLGKKPLNYVSTGDSLVFCSEIAPLLEERLTRWTIDHGALAAYLQFGYISAPRSIVREINKLPAAHYLTWRRGEVQVNRYWSYEQQPRITCTYEEAKLQVREKLDESIRLRLRSDVPLGLLLSGGLDSNAILARLVRGLGEKVQAFTAGFEEESYDESKAAAAAARHFGVEHHVLRGSTDLLQLLPEVVRHYGEPSADKSILPTMLVCGLTRQHVKVALSGDGGDEAFAGYPKHRLTARQQFASRLFPLREQLTLRAMTRGPKLLSKLLAETPSLFSGEFFSGAMWQRITTTTLRAGAEPFLHDHVAQFWSGDMDPLERILHWDNTGPLPYDLLAKLDIGSMSRSLEVRSPFLDHELVELCARLPNEWKVNSTRGKIILRDIVAPDLPPEVLGAPKRGFSVPLAQWFRGAARQQVRDGVLPLHRELQPLLNERAVAELLHEHQSSRANHAQRLWNLWVLNAWAQKFLPE